MLCSERWSLLLLPSLTASIGYLKTGSICVSPHLEDMNSRLSRPSGYYVDMQFVPHALLGRV